MTDWINQLPAMQLLSAGALVQLLAKGLLVCAAGLFFLRELELYPAALKNRIATGVIVILALLPLAAIVAPTLSLPILPRDSSTASTSPMPWINAALWLYAFVACLLGCRLLIQILRTGLIGITSEELESEVCNPQQARKIAVRQSKHINSPLTWGSIRPLILLPTNCINWSDSERQMVFQHENSHIQRGDWLTMLLARWVSILYWPVPGIRRLLAALSLSSEQACDDRVLATGTAAADYADLLVKLARKNQLEATVPLAQATGLATRVRYLVLEIVDRSTLDPLRRWVYPLCLVVALPLSAVTLVEEPRVFNRFPLKRPDPVSLEPVRVLSKPIVPAIFAPLPPAAVPEPPAALSSNSSHDWRGEDATVPPP